MASYRVVRKPSGGSGLNVENSAICNSQVPVSNTHTTGNGNAPGATHGELYGLTCKAMLIGDSGVGKTCLLVRFKDNTFLSGSFISTVGIDFRNKVIDVDGTKVKLQIWDTAGQERFRSITRAYYRDAQALLLLYDVTNEQSFNNVRVWLNEVGEYGKEDVVVVLLGNKADLTSHRVISTQQGERLARENNVAFMETSARTGLNVDLAFLAVARHLKQRQLNSSSEKGFTVSDYVSAEKTKEYKCCAL